MFFLSHTHAMPTVDSQFQSQAHITENIKKVIM